MKKQAMTSPPKYRVDAGDVIDQIKSEEMQLQKSKAVNPSFNQILRAEKGEKIIEDVDQLVKEEMDHQDHLSSQEQLPTFAQERPSEERSIKLDSSEQKGMGGLSIEG